ncbi:fluoride efflux transporter CrcB [Sphingomonas sp. SORGH_AS_0879]|uniref:fluoride efflux transporter CrcB n=1 Tax=Sphingomonas sp. SORGH_AS_0879 TaxID=3041790 RepID=UPI002784C8D8|nr:fluoride efflux transporter CrcB [Sphingomonas sp. SORGH_AS_0879]MDQ1229896.1 CrcB protein [Sphingomonas sp. SORGH_AS_0879]
MSPLLLVMLGGALGSGGRYWTGRVLTDALGAGFPFGTLAVNWIGCLAMGLLAGTLARIGGHEGWRLFIGVGVLGGYTTFSAFSLDTITLIERGQGAVALAYVALSVLGSLAALWAGLSLTRIFA